MNCPDCGRSNVKEKCRACGWRIGGAGEKESAHEPYSGSECEFRQGGWSCRHGRWATSRNRGFVLCDVHEEAVKRGASSLDDLYEILCGVRADRQQRTDPENISAADGRGGWLRGWAPPASHPHQPAPAGRYIPFHWLPIETCWKLLTGHDVLPAVATTARGGGDRQKGIGAVCEESNENESSVVCESTG